jgi:DNA-binding protein Fis
VILVRYHGNITHAAKGAGIARAHLHKLVEKYGLKGS